MQHLKVGHIISVSLSLFLYISILEERKINSFAGNVFGSESVFGISIQLTTLETYPTTTTINYSTFNSLGNVTSTNVRQ